MRLQKKSFYLLLILWLAGTLTALASDKNKLSKDAQKSWKKECKLLKKEGWKVYDKNQPLEDAMLVFFQKQETGGEQLLRVIGNGKSSKVNVAYTQAKNSASAQWATMRESNVAAATSIQIQSGGDSVSNRQQFNSNIRTNTEQTVKAFVPVVSLMRTLPDGTKEIRLYYLVNP